MLKKIPTKDLRLGMFVADVGRGWLNHPWKTKSKLISSSEEIRELLDFGITEVTVDTDQSKPAPKPEQKKDQPDASTPPPRPAAPTKPVAGKSGPDLVSDVELELPRAAKTYNKALDTSKALMAACRMNKKIELAAVQENVDELVDSVSRNRDALMALMKLRRFDDYTYTHSLNVSVLAISAGKSLGLSDEELRVRAWEPCSMTWVRAVFPAISSTSPAS